MAAICSLCSLSCRLFKGITPLWGRQIPYTMMKFGATPHQVLFAGCGCSAEKYPWPAAVSPAPSYQSSICNICALNECAVFIPAWHLAPHACKSGANLQSI